MAEKGTECQRVNHIFVTSFISTGAFRCVTLSLCPSDCAETQVFLEVQRLLEEAGKLAALGPLDANEPPENSDEEEEEEADEDSLAQAMAASALQ